MKIIDQSNLLQPTQVALLKSAASLPYSLGKYLSLDEVLTKLKVPVFIEPGIRKFNIPSSFFDDILKDIEKEIDDLKNRDFHERRDNAWEDQFEKARRKK